MSNNQDLQGGAGDRVNADVAEMELDAKGSKEMVDMGTSPPPIQGAGIDLDNAMAMDTPERARSSSRASEQEARGDDTGGGDSSLTALRGTTILSPSHTHFKLG
jgi:hypothetical protein